MCVQPAEEEEIEEDFEEEIYDCVPEELKEKAPLDEEDEEGEEPDDIYDIPPGKKNKQQNYLFTLLLLRLQK